MEIRLLAGLSPERQREVLSTAVRRRFAKGEVVFHEGDPGDSLHLLVTGKVAVKVTTPLGSVAMLSVLAVGDCFGEGALLAHDSRRTATVVALEPVETMVLFRDDFNALRRKHPEVERLLVDVLASQVRRLSSGMTEALYLPAETRLLRRLLELAELYGSSDSTIVVPLTQEDLSTMAGTTRPTANKVLQAAVERGAIKLGRGRVEVLDLEALRRLAR